MDVLVFGILMPTHYPVQIREVPILTPHSHGLHPQFSYLLPVA